MSRITELWQPGGRSPRSVAVRLIVAHCGAIVECELTYFPHRIGGAGHDAVGYRALYTRIGTPDTQTGAWWVRVRSLPAR
jgi:hypothetical protein